MGGGGWQVRCKSIGIRSSLTSFAINPTFSLRCQIFSWRLGRVFHLLGIIGVGNFGGCPSVEAPVYAQAHNCAGTR